MAVNRIDSNVDNKNVIIGPESHVPISQLSVGKQIFDNLKRSDPNKHLLIDAFTEKTETIGEFLQNTCRLANCLTRGIDLNFDDVVTISSENNNYFLETVVASFYAGICLAPINHNYTEVELQHVLDITKPKLIFSSKNNYQKFLRLKATLKYIEKIVVYEFNEPETDDVIDYHDFINKYSKISDVVDYEPAVLDTYNHLAVILCSSGTTGLPKGVMTTHRNLNARLTHVTDLRLNNYKSNTVFLGLMPFFHGFGFTTCVGYLVNGYTTVYMDRFDGRTFLKCIEKYKMTHIYLAPPLMIFLAKSPFVDDYDLSCLEEIGCGAAPLGKEVEDIVRNRLKSVRIFQAYGLTETTLAVLQSYRKDPIKSGSSGKIMPTMMIRIRNPDTGATLGRDQVGEICFKGPLVVPGYYKNYVATKQMFDESGWLLTGDLGYYDDENYFYVVDRLKELIKYKGFQVAPAELEAILLKHPQIKDAAVIGIPHEETGEVPLAYVVKEPMSTLKEEDVVKFIAEQVTRSKQLHGGVRFLDEIPKNPTGKILRRVLRQRANNQTKSKL